MFTLIKTRFLVGSILLMMLMVTFAWSDPSQEVLSEQYEFDDQGRLVQKIAPDSSKTSYEYDEQGALTKISYPGDTVSYGYDADGNRIRMQDKTGVTLYCYDAFDRLIGVMHKHSPTRLIVYNYNPWGDLASVSIYDPQLMEQDFKYKDMLDRLRWESFKTQQEWRDQQFRFQNMIHELSNESWERQQRWQEYQVKYDYFQTTGNLKSVDFGAGRIEYSYHPEKGEVIRQLPNGIRSTFSYLPSGELKTIRHEDRENRLIASYDYRYDPPGKVSSVTERTAGDLKTTSYYWNSRGYLNSLHTSNDLIRFDYDPMGNRLWSEDLTGKSYYKYDNFGRLTQAGDVNFQWSKSGNLISQMSPQQTISYQYNWRNQPISIKSPSTTVNLNWDGAGNMVTKTVGNTTTYYLPDPLSPPGFTLAEYNATGKMGTSYLYGGGALLGHWDATKGTQFYLEDGFSSIRNVIDLKGNTVSHQDFTPFAEPVLVKGLPPTSFRTAGERILSLPETRLSVINDRIYDPQMGRYQMPESSPGNMRRPDSFNRYLPERASGTFMEPVGIQTRKNSYAYAPIMPNLESYGLYNPIEHPFRAAWSIARIPFPGLFKAAIDAPGYWRASTGKGFDVTLPVSASYLIGGAIASGGRSLILFSTPSLASAPLVFLPLLQGVLHGYWNFVFSTFAETDRLLAESKERMYSSANLYRVKTDSDYDQRKFYKGPDWPDDGGGGGGSGGPGGGLGGPLGGGRFYDPFKSIESRLGGIDLNAPAQFLGNLGTITGAVYDPKTQSLSLVGDEDISLPPLNPQDMAVALLCVYGPIPQDPQFSLDPADPKNPRGERLKAVYIPEKIIAGTEFGKALLEADWLLKQYSFGISIDSNWNVSKRVSSVPGFKSLADLYFENPDTTKREETWVRFWIVPDSMVIKKQENSIYFDECKMRVKAMKMVETPEGLKDVPTEEDPKATAFAELFTRLYDEIAKESPEFARVKELAKVVALVKWLKKENIPVDMNWVWEYAVQKRDTLVEVSRPALSLNWKRGEKLYHEEKLLWSDNPLDRLHVFGGVDLTDKSEYVPDDGTAQNLQQKVESAIQNENVGPIFSVVHRQMPTRAVVLPITESGQEMWNKSPSVLKEGVAYQYNPQTKLITKATDVEGNISEFTYDPDHELRTVKSSSVDGWITYGERKDQGTEWAVTNPKGNNIINRYESSGYLHEIQVDGEKLVTCDYDQNQGLATIRYKDYVEKRSIDPKGYIKEYELRKVTKDGETSQERERVSFTYNDAKKVTKIEGTEVPAIEISYAEDGTTPLSVNSPQGAVQFSYDALKRVQNITLPDRSSITFSYEGEKLAKMQVKHSEGRQAEYLFGEDGIVQSRDFLGGVAEYGYEKGLLSSARLAQGEDAEYIYDDQNRLQQIHLPDGSWIEYQYQGRLLSVITHPAPGDNK